MDRSTYSPTQPPVREHSVDHAACVTIIDDEPINIEVVKAYLSEAGFSNFRSTSDSRNALELMEENQPDIVLLDINMPHRSGLEILELMRQNLKTSKKGTVRPAKSP